MYAVAGPIATALAGMQTLLANCSYFQTWTGTNNPTAAAASIFLGEAGFPIASVEIAGGSLVVTTRETHNLSSGQYVTLQGAALGPQSLDLAGTYAITGTTANSFTAALGGSLALTYPKHCFVLPSSEAFVTIEESEQGALDSDVIGTGGASLFSGAIDVVFENAIPSQYANDPINALAQARSEYGQLLQAIAQTQGTADYICLNNVQTVEKAQFTAQSRQDDGTIRFERWMAILRVTWGLKS